MSDALFGELLSDQRWAGKIFNGRWVAAQGGTRDVVEPATGKSVASVGLGNAADVAIAATAATAAQRGWAALSARDRAEVLRQAAALARRHASTLAVLVARETGGIVPKGEVELREAEAILHSAAALALQPRGEILQGQVGRMSLARRVPRGVVGVISPFNFPLILSMRALAPALASGNAVVLKPDIQTPLSGGYLIARLFEEAGLPPGVLHVLPGGAEAGEALCLHPAVQMIQFTGSTAIGRRVAELAGKTLKKVSLELGGNNALIVLDDANVEAAVNNAAWGAWLHQGQICMASSRVFVHNAIREDFTSRLAEKAKHLPAGNPATDRVPLGPMINERQLRRFRAIIDDSVKAGARIEAGGSFRQLFHEATVLSGVKPGMRAFDEEIFGPMASIIGFQSDEEALTLANRHEGALAAAVISRDVGRALRLAEQLHAGIVHINDQTVNDEVSNPFGAPGVAGAGSSVGAPADLDEYTRWQWLTIRDVPPQYPF